MMRTDHNEEFEQLMAYLDGELADADAANVRAHLAQCPSCQELELELRAVSGRITSWTVGEPPASLKSPAVRSRMVALRRWAPMAAMLIVTAGAATLWVVMRPLYSVQQEAESMSATPEPARELALAYPGSVAARLEPPGETSKLVTATAVLPPELLKPLLARSAQLTLVASDLNAARPEVERIIGSHGGYVTYIRFSSERGTARALTASLRVPEQALDAALSQLQRLGRVKLEGRDAEDVTQESTDLDARLSNARTSEKRLVSILANRAGDVADVLNVEREIARVRGEIEQMEAARRTLDRRISFATIQLEMTEEQKAELGLGDQSVARRLRNATVEGWNDALDGTVEIAVFIAQVAPTMLLWGLALIVPYRLIRRRFT